MQKGSPKTSLFARNLRLVCAMPLFFGVSMCLVHSSVGRNQPPADGRRNRVAPVNFVSHRCARVIGRFLFAVLVLGSALNSAIPVRAQTAINPLMTAASSAAAQGRQHPSYQVFAAQNALPTISTPDDATLTINGAVTINVQTPASIPAKDEAMAADQFGISPVVLSKILERISSNGPPAAPQFAKQLSSAVLDYKYLVAKWTGYHPPTGTEELKTKTTALQVLQAGDIDKAWVLFMALPRPQAPAGLRVTNAGP